MSQLNRGGDGGAASGGDGGAASGGDGGAASGGDGSAASGGDGGAASGAVLLQIAAASLQRSAALATATREMNERLMSVLGGRGEKGAKGEKGVASTTSGVGATPVAEVQERTAAASDTSSPPKEMNAERHLRTLRKKIAEDPEAFFAQADADRSKDLAWDEWQEICRVHVEDISLDTIRALYGEVARARDTTGTISHARFLQVGEEYRAVRHFIEDSECMGVLVDGLISTVNELRSTPPDGMQGEQAADGGAAHVLQLLSHLSESDLQAVAARLASPLCDQAAKMKRERTDRGLDPAVPHEKADGTGSKFADLHEAAYGPRKAFFEGLDRVGVPHPKATEAMEREFTQMKDSKQQFESWNSGKIETTPEKEFSFVKEPFKPESVSENLPPCQWETKHDYGGRTPIRLQVFLHATWAFWGDVRFGHFKCAYEYCYENGKRNPLWLHPEEVSMVKVVLLRFVKSQLDGLSLRAAFKQGGLALEDKEASLKADKIAQTLGSYFDRTDGPRSTSTFVGAVEALAVDAVATEKELEALIDYFHAKFKEQKIKEGEVIATRLYTGPG